MDRRAANTALAKAIAYVECGKPDKAVEWVATLLSDFVAAGVDVEYAFRLSEAIVPIDVPAPDLSAASDFLGRRLLG